MTQISLNGIRLSRPMAAALRRYDLEGDTLHKALAAHRINMVNAGGHFKPDTLNFTCCLDPEACQQPSVLDLLPDFVFPVSLVSLYPHKEDSKLLWLLLDLLKGSPFVPHHLTSSHAVISLVLDTSQVDDFISLLETRVTLPDSRTPYVQEVDMDISEVLQKYPETRSSYEEERIKTYGIQLLSDLSMTRDTGDLDAILETESMGPRAGSFVFVSMVRSQPQEAGNSASDLILITRGELSGSRRVDLIRFHGPHFGDRYRILQTALDCLEKAGIPLICFGCTGASIALVLDAGQGTAAQSALGKGFEAP